MTIKNIIAHLVGVASIGAAAAWAALDVKGDGHIDQSTVHGVFVLATLGGWLIDKTKTREFVAFLATQAKDILSAFASTPAGSDTEK